MPRDDPCTGGNGCARISQSENGMARCACHTGYQLSEDKNTCKACSLETNEKECGSICNCQNGGTCDLLTRLSQGYLRSWLLFRMSVCGGEHPGMQCQKW
ncbi:uncharacterized protein LOC101039884 isoform X4 [Saimiri boliviensis]|uniref:uncharacterized protein LOC101039884 isoform X4 n=1 Tax=Saimiri boliviensis TaxID=27679 RepID=UPI003D789E13